MKDTDQDIPGWLRNLQENSWQLEMFVSGGAIFSLVQLSEHYIDWIFMARMTMVVTGLGFSTVLGMLGIKLLTVGFFAHLLLRGYWIGLVCLNDVYQKVPIQTG